MSCCPCFGRKKAPKPRDVNVDYVGNCTPSPLIARLPHLPSAKPKFDEPKMELPIAKDQSHTKNNARTFLYRELAAVTKNFRSDSFIGEGGFGPVYKGHLESIDQDVAVKKLNETGLQGNKEFLVEVLMLSLLRHPNLVNLIGYCAEGDQRLLVYEFMPLGSLENHLHDLTPDMKPLDWNTRLRIAAGAARGLNYLHNEASPPVIYRDLKSANILLNVGYEPKLSDFGLAKFGPSDLDKSHVSTRIMGTYGYCAPEYAASGKLTMKSDIYSFGVVLLELITGRRAVDSTCGNGNHLLVNWVKPMLLDRKNYLQLADRRLKGQFVESTFRKFVEVAKMCLRETPRARPSMSDVALALDYLASQQYDPNVTPRRHGGGERGRRVSEREEQINKNKMNSKESEDSPMLVKDPGREQAIAEAKMWGETCREKRQQIVERDFISTSGQ